MGRVYPFLKAFLLEVPTLFKGFFKGTDRDFIRVFKGILSFSKGFLSFLKGFLRRSYPPGIPTRETYGKLGIPKMESHALSPAVFLSLRKRQQDRKGRDSKKERWG